MEKHVGMPTWMRVRTHTWMRARKWAKCTLGMHCDNHMDACGDAHMDACGNAHMDARLDARVNARLLLPILSVGFSNALSPY